MSLIFLAVISAAMCFASNDEVKVGLYSGAIEIHDSVAFELMKSGKAVVTSDYFNLDGTKNKSPRNIAKGTWSYREPFLTISYGNFKDKLRRENCPQPNPCYKFEEASGKKTSPLNVPYGFSLRAAK